MACHTLNPCKWGCLLVACILGALGLQTFVALIAAAVSIGNGYTMWFAIAHIYSWSIFFLSLFLSFLMTATCLLKCCAKAGFAEKSTCCAPKADTDDTIDAP